MYVQYGILLWACLPESKRVFREDYHTLILVLSHSHVLQRKRIVVQDDAHWADRYQHIIPANMMGSPYVTQYAFQVI